MDKIKASKLPGFYTDERGAYGIIIDKDYICCFINSDDNKYDVTVDGIDENGDFADTKEWESFDNPEDAIARLRRFVRGYRHHAYYC